MNPLGSLELARWLTEAAKCGGSDARLVAPQVIHAGSGAGSVMFSNMYGSSAIVRHSVRAEDGVVVSEYTASSSPDSYCCTVSEHADGTVVVRVGEPRRVAMVGPVMVEYSVGAVEALAAAVTSTSLNQPTTRVEPVEPCSDSVPLARLTRVQPPAYARGGALAYEPRALMLQARLLSELAPGAARMAELATLLAYASISPLEAAGAAAACSLPQLVAERATYFSTAVRGSGVIRAAEEFSERVSASVTPEQASLFEYTAAKIVRDLGGKPIVMALTLCPPGEPAVLVVSSSRIDLERAWRAASFVASYLGARARRVPVPPGILAGHGCHAELIVLSA